MTDAGAGLVPPRFLSLAERDRRHRDLHAKMAEQDLDILILPATANRWEQCMADSRYVTGIGSFGTETLTIIARDRPPTAYVFNRAGWWKAQQQWIPDVRDGRNRWGANVVQRLTELGFQHGRIGLSGLAGQTRTPDGVVPYGTYVAIASAFPQAKLVDATDLVLDLRSIKSHEEVDVMRAAARITDRMVETMRSMAVPGQTERCVYSAMIKTMLDLGGELPVLTIFATGPNVSHGQFVPTDRVLVKGDRFANEFEARLAGYGAQTLAPLSIGKPDDAYCEAVRVSLAAFEAANAALRPGKSMQDVLDASVGAIRSEGKGRFRHLFPWMAARGLGDEIPTVIHEGDAKLSEIEIKANMVFAVKPQVALIDGDVHAQMGDTVVVTRSGGRRLGERPLELIVVD